MRQPLLALAALAASATAALACDANPICTVKDPTGTPLNVRASAGGKILATLRNGQKLEFIDHVEIKGAKWARVAVPDPRASESGYVLKSYLQCKGSGDMDNGDPCTVRDPTGTPLNIRAEPNGEVVGALRNGTRVRAYSETMHDGKTWVVVARSPEDNAVGYVFDAYLKCAEDGGH